MSIDFPSFHDGYLDGLLLRDQTATLYLSRADGEAYTLHLDGVEAIQMDDFRRGNIVADLEVSTRCRLDADARFDRLFEPPHPSAEARFHEKHTRFVEGHLSRIATGEMKLVSIMPVYGADLLALCREVACCRA